jgi:hypothetical protein
MSLKEQLEAIVAADVEQLVRKDAEYGSSWKSRGGTGAFHQALGRKWDRIENQCQKFGYDLFAAIRADTRAEGLLDDLGDLRRYCMLIEAEVKSWNLPATRASDQPRGYVPAEDNRPE